MEIRFEFVLQARKKEVPFAQLCEDYGVSRPTGYLWLRRYEEAGTLNALKDRSCRPQRSSRQTPPELEAQVVQLRGELGWGARKLKSQLRGGCLSEATINRILARRGLLAPERPQPATKRFEREACNELAQMDFKGHYPVREGRCYPLSLLDDHSRYLLGLWPLAETSTEATKGVLEPFFRSQGMPQALLLDHGSPWWSTSNGHGLTRLSVWLMKQGIGLHFSRIRHPQTQGKVERFHRTLKDRTRHAGLPGSLGEWEAWAEHFRREYNERRPHEALAMQTPAQVYQPQNLLPYQDSPSEWDYGEATIARLNSAGCLYYRQRQYFVCEALAEERVRLDELDHLLIVTFQKTTVREIDLRTGETRPVLFTERIQ